MVRQKQHQTRITKPEEESTISYYRKSGINPIEKRILSSIPGMRTAPTKPKFRGLSYELAEEANSVQLQADIKPKENKTGLPDSLKAGLENLSSMAMDDVKVHYNSSKPSQLQALAYTQGTDIHLAPGEEQHLPHEAWHVVQQKQGRVKPTIQTKGVAINDDVGLEREAEVMGEQASRQELGEIGQKWHHGDVIPNYTSILLPMVQRVTPNTGVIQCAKVYKKWVFGLPHWEVVFKDIENGGLWQVGFANPTGIKETSGSVGTKSGSPIGYGGEGQVHWTKLKEGKESKGGYEFILEDNDQGSKDGELMGKLPQDGTREKYRLTNQNCQHFIAKAWKDAGLTPNLEPYLTISEETGNYVNSALFVGLVGAIAAAAYYFLPSGKNL